ncbi:MAG: dephospho-CoA kinase [Burkholderiaceae bacterium]|jgi:dephospho-CoA kinase|nr:dephospho-CoA kinase [Burkholderiaceae bacterium]
MSAQTQNTFFLGLTGGIGSGKTTVASLFADLGAGVVDTDDVARNLTRADGKAIDAIRSCFGDVYIAPDGAMDRDRMRERVFRDKAAKDSLESILHPLIRQEALQLAGKQRGDYVIFVIPLLTKESVWCRMLARILVVDCTEAQQIERVMKRNGLDRDQVRAIMSAQLSREERLLMADDVIVNDGELTRLSDSVVSLHDKYRKMAKSRHLTDFPPAFD